MSGVVGLRSVIEALRAFGRDFEPRTLDGDGAREVFELLATGERLCAAAKARAAVRIDETKVWRADGARSAAHWVADASGVSVGAASDALVAARVVDVLPVLGAAFVDGQLSVTQAAEIGEVATVAPGSAGELLAAAGELSVKGLRDRCRAVRASVADDREWAQQLHVRR